MKPREIFKAQIEHRETETVPYTISFQGDVDRELDEYYGGIAWLDSIQTFQTKTGVLDNMKKVPTDMPGLERDIYGSIWRIDRRPFHLEQPVLLEPSFSNYRWPAPQEFYFDKTEIEEARKECREQKDEYFIIGSLGWGLFETL